MQIEFRLQSLEGSIRVRRGPNDPPIRRSTGWAGDADSQFWHELKKKLNSDLLAHPLGQLIKRRMQTDGHMMGGEGTQYLRSPSAALRKGGGVLVYDENYAIRLACDTYNAGRPVVLRVTSAAEGG